MDTAFLIVLNSLQVARPTVAEALECLVDEPVKNHAELLHLKAASGTLKEDANALVAILIARHSDDDMITEAEELFRYFGQVEAQIAATIEIAALPQPRARREDGPREAGP